MNKYPNEHHEIYVPAGAREEFLEKEVADLKEELSRKTEMLCAMEAELRNVAEGQMEWISVEDRLPEKQDELCLVYRKNGSICLSVHYCETNHYWSYGDVSHWMPLPKPPKQKEPTFKDVFLKAFPKAWIESNGQIRAFCCHIFPQVFGCDGDKCLKYISCEQCWNQPYFEGEEKE